MTPEIEFTDEDLLSALPSSPKPAVVMSELCKTLCVHKGWDYEQTTQNRNLEQMVRRRLYNLEIRYPQLVEIDNDVKPNLYRKKVDPVHENKLIIRQLSMIQHQVGRYLPMDFRKSITSQHQSQHHASNYWQQYIYLAPSSVWQSPDYDDAVLETVYLAIEQQTALAFDYRNIKGQLLQKQLMPWGLMFKAEKTYLMGIETHLNVDKPVPYALHRVSNVVTVPVQRHFRSKPRGVTLKDICQQHDIGLFTHHEDPLINLELRFYSNAARFIDETPLSKDQHLAELDDNTRLLTATVRDCYELRKFIRSFGKLAEVISPAYLRNEIAAEFKTLCALYEEVPDLTRVTDQ